MLSTPRSAARRAIVARAVGADHASRAEAFVEERLTLFDPVPKILLRAGECIATIPAIGTRLPGGRQYSDFVGGLATAYALEHAEDSS